MAEDNLKDHLAKLRAELTDADQADPASKQSLHDAIRDAETSADPTLPDRLEKLAVQFEADHPTLAASARRLVDLLSEVGI